MPLRITLRRRIELWLERSDKVELIGVAVPVSRPESERFHGCRSPSGTASNRRTTFDASTLLPQSKLLRWNCSLVWQEEARGEAPRKGGSE
jgi:hypothetical protein